VGFVPHPASADTAGAEGFNVALGRAFGHAVELARAGMGGQGRMPPVPRARVYQCPPAQRRAGFFVPAFGLSTGAAPDLANVSTFFTTSAPG
jgi:hypothetical protein